MTDAIKWDQPELIADLIEEAAKKQFYHVEVRGGFITGAHWMLEQFRNKHEAEPAPSKELWARVAALLRDLREEHLRYDLHDREQDFVARTAAILAELEPKPDPLEQAVDAVFASPGALTNRQFAFHLRGELAKRGIELGEAK